MKNKTIGIIALVSVLAFLFVLMLVVLSGTDFRASNVQLLIVLFISSIVTSGIYLIRKHCPTIQRISMVGISGYGIVLIVFSILISYNVIHFLTTINWLISGSIVFVLLIQLQLLQWGKEANLLAKICAFSVLLSSLFLAIYFITAASFHGIALWLDVAILISLTSFIVGLIASHRVVQQHDS